MDEVDAKSKPGVDAKSSPKYGERSEVHLHGRGGEKERLIII